AGLVIGVDIAKIKPLPWDNVKTLRLDVTLPSTVEAVKKQLPREADVVLSDLSPKVTGVWEVDSTRQALLARSALSIAIRTLRKDGRFVVKLFQGAEATKFVEEVKKFFNRVKLTKPKASRKGSAEIYVVALGFKGQLEEPFRLGDEPQPVPLSC
ncbi:MAG: FtsJ-like methyltransferase family protein, partial [Candidatus Nezhaarchaeales archaeon]